MPRRTVGALAALLSLAPLAVTTASAEPAAAPPRASLVIEGKGFGHGVGMAQDGALAMASAGASATAILSHFYPGTAIARRTATVRVGVADVPGPIVVVLPGGGEVRDAPSGPQSPGFPITVNPGGSVSLAFEGGKYKATPLANATLTRTPAPPAPGPAPAATPNAPPTTAPATPPTTSILDPLLQALLPTTVPPTTVPPTTAPAAAGTIPASQTFGLTGRGLWAVPKGDTLVALPESGRSYRGTVIAAAGGHGIQLTDELDVEQYLRGMGEMPASWPAAALQAQAIAARTYAIRAASAGRTLCDDQQCQVYIGAGNETAATTAAATATRGQVLTYQGALAETVYSASAGGISATPAEGFGPDSPDLPYLQPVTYPVSDPQLWATSLPLTEVAARFAYQGELQDVRVTRTGPSGRPLEITFNGANGPMVVDAHRFFSVLQLRSTLFTLRTEVPAAAGAGEPLNAQVPEFPGLVGSRATPALARPAVVPASTLGRAPWVGLAFLLLAMWATAAHRAADRSPVPAAAGTTGTTPTGLAPLVGDDPEGADVPVGLEPDPAAGTTDAAEPTDHRPGDGLAPDEEGGPRPDGPSGEALSPPEQLA
ncbi:MAG TPA: SpoIID/LytB domain-containing protein [Acidimicrobiales bacterium]|nr:SpoIID/LytB domain-containing protein [Acidimicrobiales bacterium]